MAVCTCMHMHVYIYAHMLNMYKSILFFLNTGKGSLALQAEFHPVFTSIAHSFRNLRYTFHSLELGTPGTPGPGLSIQQYRLIPPPSSQSPESLEKGEVRVSREEEGRGGTQKSQMQTPQAGDMPHCRGRHHFRGLAHMSPARDQHCESLKRAWRPS